MKVTKYLVIQVLVTSAIYAWVAPQVRVTGVNWPGVMFLFGMVFGLTIGLLTKYIFKEGKNYSDTMLPIFQKKVHWLHNVLANDLYRAYPELWPWIKQKLDEYNQEMFL